MQIHIWLKLKRNLLSIFFVALILGVTLATVSCRKGIASRPPKRTTAPCKCNKKPLPRMATYNAGAINNSLIGNDF
jgi:hypothetical protein